MSGSEGYKPMTEAELLAQMYSKEDWRIVPRVRVVGSALHYMREVKELKAQLANCRNGKRQLKEQVGMAYDLGRAHGCN